MATFGKTAIGSSVTYTWMRDGVIGCKFSLPENGKVTKISAYLHPDNWDKASGVIYSDASGAPNVRQGYTTEYELLGTDWAWYDFIFDIPISLLAAAYWLNIVGNGTSNRYYYYDTGGTNQFCYEHDINGYTVSPFPPPNPLGTPTGYFDREMCIYATYTPTEEKPLISKPLISPLLVSTPIIRQIKPFSKRFPKFEPRVVT